MNRRIENLGKPDVTGQIAQLGARTAAVESALSPVVSSQALILARANEAVAIAQEALDFTGDGGTYGDEQARDAIGGALRGGDGLGIVINDPANTITIAIDTPSLLFNRLGLGTLATVNGSYSPGATVSGTNTGDQINVPGNAGTATRLATARTINGVPFDGSSNITINATDVIARQVQDADLDAIAQLTTQMFGRSLLTYSDAANVRSALGLGSAALVNTGATNGTVPLIGADNKLSAAIMPALAITDVFDVNSQAEMLALTAQRGDVAIRNDINDTYILSTDDPTVLANWKVLKKPTGGGGSGTVTNVSVVTANGVSGTVQNPSTNAAITLALGAITPSSVVATGNVTGANLSGTNTGDQTSVTGNAGTATKLATARAINGVAFDGTANITVADDTKLARKQVINTYTASRTAVAADAEAFVQLNVSSANTYTVPTNASVPLAMGTRIDLQQAGAGQMSVVAASGVIILSDTGYLKLKGRYAAATLLNVGPDTWTLVGALVA